MKWRSNHAKQHNIPKFVFEEAPFKERARTSGMYACVRKGVDRNPEVQIFISTLSAGAAKLQL
jgi:hypothetical protein